ncbi:hypothetical protein [Rufibacter ruber]|uniref:hypothetical protein n=1 Tax=Rufibacter ruber TaxID=1783499 RepID=UPI000B11D19B|nr:hypothetical protein [Rufibacter ruber]
MRNPLLCLTMFLASCQPSTQPPSEGTATTSNTTVAAPAPSQHIILSKNRRFVYLARWYAPAATEATLDTVVMTASGEPWKIDSTQTVYEWLFKEDTTLTYIPKEHVGGIERAEKFWLHPPRYGKYAILELNPFPDIRLPARKGQAWEWTVYPPDFYSDPAWAIWKGMIDVKNRYRTEDTALVDTPLGKLTCQRVQSTGTSKFGTTTLETYFHPLYGFVRLNYVNINGSKTELEMLSANVQLESYDKGVERVFGKVYK